MLSFKPLTVATSLLCLGLAAIWFAWPEWILTHWHMTYDYDGGFMSRRMACLFLALSVILMSLRNAASPVVRGAVGNGVITACLSLIALGIYEWLSGHVGVGIFAAISLESVLTVAYFTVSSKKPRLTPQNPPEPAAPVR